MFNRRNLYLSYLIIAINVIITCLMFLSDNSFSVYTLISYGAKYNPMIAAGQYYRLITSMFLHADLTHLLFNMYALSILGKNIEIIYGKFKFLVIYLVAGIFGSLGSFIFNDSVSVGASGAIFGLFGALIYLYISRPNIFSLKQLLNLLALIGINLFLGIILPSIDNWAHIWGLIGGFVISWSIGIKGENLITSSKAIAHILTIILIITSFISGIKLNQDTWQYNLFKGVEFLKKNEIDEAEYEFKSGINKNPNVDDFYFYLGHISYIKGNIKEAKNNFKKAIEINPNFIEAKKMLKKLQN